MSKLNNLIIIFATLLASTTRAADNIPDTVCHSSAIGVQRGTAFNVSVMTNGTCEIAGLYFPGQKSIDMEIGLNQSSCNSASTMEQFFQVQLSRSAPLGKGQIRFVCNDLVENHCIRFWVEESTSTEGFDSNQIQGACPYLSSETVPIDPMNTTAQSNSPTQSRPPQQSVSSSQLPALLQSVTAYSGFSSVAATLPSTNGTTLSVRWSAGSYYPLETPLATHAFSESQPEAISTHPSRLPMLATPTSNLILPQPDGTSSAVSTLIGAESSLSMACTCQGK
jgi:hypothetical protein